MAKNDYMSKLNKYGREFCKGIHREWESYERLTNKIVESKVLSKKEAKMLLSMCIGNMCQYFGGDMNYVNEIEKRIEKLIEKTYKVKKCQNLLN